MISLVIFFVAINCMLKPVFRQAIDMFMSSCTLFVFFSLIEYAFVNVMMGDIR